MRCPPSFLALEMKCVDDQQAQAVMQELVARGQITDPDSARGKLLQTAAHLFRSKGYERTTVRDLAGAVGIQSGSIFHHFKSKDEILRSVMEETIRYNTALMQASLAEASDLRGRVLALIRCELQSIMGGTGEAMAVLVYEWRSLTPASQAVILELRDIYEGLWLGVLEEARAAGFVKSDPFILRRFLTGALSWTNTWFRPEGPMGLDQLAEEALLLVFKEPALGL
ncbi:transcriptional regulator, TetR family [Pseudomonas cuatrocienegasensis]|uniref:Transcriptional regulator, TetR family n=1 Tax=Pseudomonas cuatrocienegasensis TaxID=543360 RepID=A0ABY1B0X7_9PSED|nr:transcriptional regulator, TetR family [Pseudomonas cuatrocienegasensis]